VRSTKSDCERIKHAVAKMVGGSRITCSHQFDTDAFLVTIELHQRMKMLRLTGAEYRGSNWQDVLLKSVSDWLATVTA
jgi:hypothetical protein